MPCRLIPRESRQSACVTFAVIVTTAALCAISPIPALSQEAPARKLATDSEVESLGSLKSGTHLIRKDSTGEVTVLQNIPPQILKDAQQRFLLQQRKELYDLKKLELTGDIEDEMIRLTVNAIFEVEQEDEWVRVPVGFSNFHLTDLKHSTGVANGQARFEKTRLPQKSWLLFGKGEHRLELKLIGQVKVTTNGKHRIQISAPKATISSLLLRSTEPIEQDSIELSSRNPFRLKTDEATGASEIETWGLPATSEIAWVPQPETQDTIATVQASGPAQMKLDLVAGSGSLTVQQPLTISGGAISVLNVRLPEHFAQVSINGHDSEGHNIVKPVSIGEDNTAAIQFVAPITGNITLNYDLGLPDAKYPQSISVQIPDIESVANETGDVEIFVPVGLELDVQRPDEKNTRQKRVQASGEPGTAVVAYRLLSSDSKLDLKVSETEAFYSVDPLISLEAERNSVVLKGYFTINMVRGSLNELEIDWPGYGQEGWTILQVLMGQKGNEKTRITGLPSPENDTFRVSFPGRQAGQFEIELHAVRDLGLFQNDNRLLFLPDISAPTPHTAKVALIESDSFAMSLRPQNQQAPFPSLPVSQLPQHLQDEDMRLSAWIVDSPKEAVDVQISPQQSEVRSQVLAELSVVNDRIHISETITYDVLHEDLSKITLVVPGPTPSVQLDGWLEPLEPGEQDAELTTYGLPETRRGKLKVHVDFYWSPNGGAEIGPGTITNIPLVLPAVADQLKRVTVATNSPESLVLANQPNWERVYSNRFSAAWKTEERPTTTPVTLRHPLKSRREFHPQFLVLKSVVQGQTLVTSITSIFSEPQDSILFSLNNATGIIEQYIDGQTAELDVIADDDSRRTVALRRSADRTASSLSTATMIVRQNISGQNSLFSSFTADIPQIVGSDHNCNGIWIVAQDSQDLLVHSGRSLTELDHRITQHLADGIARRDASEANMVQAITALVSPYGSSVENKVLSLLKKPLDSSDRYMVLAGPVNQSPQSLYFVPRRTTLLMTAMIGLLLYLLVARLQAVPLLAILATMWAVVTALLAIAPNPGLLILSRTAPGCLLAIVAALLQRTFGRRNTAPNQRDRLADQSTIFTIEKPVNSSVVADSVSRNSASDQPAALSHP